MCGCRRGKKVLKICYLRQTVSGWVLHMIYGVARIESLVLKEEYIISPCYQ